MAGDNAVVVAGVATVGIVVAAVGIAAAAAASLASMLRAAAAVVAVEAAADIVVEQSGVGHAVAAHTADNTAAAAAAAAAAARTADSLQQPLPAASDVCGVCECLHVYNVSEWCAYWRQAQAEDVECTSHYRFKGQG